MSLSPIARIPLLLSALCLDAPLVAVGWAILISNSKHLHPPTLAALFFAVWAIYLADRIRDSKTDSTPDGETVRHQFAEHHRGLMIALFILAILGGVFAALSGLQTETILAGSGVATATAGYFVIIGWRNQNPSPRFLPVKEIAIALCFACGVKIGAGTPHFVEWLTWDTLALASLFLTNCLVISKAETSRDRSIDPHAFFCHILNSIRTLDCRPCPAHHRSRIVSRLHILRWRGHLPDHLHGRSCLDQSMAEKTCFLGSGSKRRSPYPAMDRRSFILTRLTKVATSSLEPRMTGCNGFCISRCHAARRIREPFSSPSRRNSNTRRFP